MCNDYRLEVGTSKIFGDFADLKIKIRFSEGAPNIQARQDIKITDTAPIVRTIEGEPRAGDLVQRRWSWPGERQTGLQFPLRRTRVHLGALLNRRRSPIRSIKGRGARTNGCLPGSKSHGSASPESGGSAKIWARPLSFGRLCRANVP